MYSLCKYVTKAKTGTIKKIRKENKKRTKGTNKRTKGTRKHQ